MKAHSSECCHGARRSRSLWPRGAVGGALFGLLAVLMPKCPLCIAAWLAVFGLSGLAARVDPRAIWLVAAFALALAAAAIVHGFLGRDDNNEGDGT